MSVNFGYCDINPYLCDFKATTCREAIVKLHRLNASSHASPDDWHLNMIEATADLKDPEHQLQFYNYCSNPSGYKENKELWDALEKFDKHFIDPQIVKEVAHDPFDESNFTQESKTIGATQYIFVKNENWSPPSEPQEAILDTVPEECDDKQQRFLPELNGDMELLALGQEEEKVFE